MSTPLMNFSILWISKIRKEELHCTLSLKRIVAMRTPLCYCWIMERTSIQSMYINLYTYVKLLLFKVCLKISFRTFSDIQKKYRRLVLTIFDRGLTLKKNRGDLENDELWTLECNFRCNNYSEKMKYDMMRYNNEICMLDTIMRYDLIVVYIGK